MTYPEPVTLAEARLHCRASASDSDFLDLAIRAARAKCEGLLQRALISRTVQQRYDTFDNAGLRFDIEPVASVTAVTYIDAQGQQQALDPANWQLALSGIYPLLLPAWGSQWPAARQSPGAVQVSYVAGYGPTPATVPDDIRTWLLLTIGTLYTQREATVTGSSQPIPGRFYDSLLDPHRRYGF